MLDKLKNLAGLKKQAGEMKKQLDAENVSGSALGGKVRIFIDGSQKVKEVFIDESLLNVESKEDLEMAVKDAFEKANKEMQMIMFRKMQSGEMQMPSL